MQCTHRYQSINKFKWVILRFRTGYFYTKKKERAEICRWTKFPVGPPHFITWWSDGPPAKNIDFHPCIDFACCAALPVSTRIYCILLNKISILEYFFRLKWSVDTIDPVPWLWYKSRPSLYNQVSMTFRSKVLACTKNKYDGQTDGQIDGHPKPIGPQPFGLWPNNSCCIPRMDEAFQTYS